MLEAQTNSVARTSVSVNGLSFGRSLDCHALGANRRFDPRRQEDHVFGSDNVIMTTLSKATRMGKDRPYPPDGICLDAEGAIWLSATTRSAVVRVKEGGEISEMIKVETDTFACALGGPDRKTLFVLTAASSDPEQCRRAATGRICLNIELQISGRGICTAGLAREVKTVCADPARVAA